jgi:hypothetical protein
VGVLQLLSNIQPILKEQAPRRRSAQIADQLIKQGMQPTQAAQTAKTKVKPKFGNLNKQIIAKRGLP